MEEEEEGEKKKKKKTNLMCYTTVKVILISSLRILHRRCTSVSLHIPSGIYKHSIL